MREEEATKKMTPLPEYSKIVRDEAAPPPIDPVSYFNSVDKDGFRTEVSEYFFGGSQQEVNVKFVGSRPTTIDKMIFPKGDGSIGQLGKVELHKFQIKTVEGCDLQYAHVSTLDVARHFFVNLHKVAKKLNLRNPFFLAEGSWAMNLLRPLTPGPGDMDIFTDAMRGVPLKKKTRFFFEILQCYRQGPVAVELGHKKSNCATFILRHREEVTKKNYKRKRGEDVSQNLAANGDSQQQPPLLKIEMVFASPSVSISFDLPVCGTGAYFDENGDLFFMGNLAVFTSLFRGETPYLNLLELDLDEAIDIILNIKNSDEFYSELEPTREFTKVRLKITQARFWKYHGRGFRMVPMDVFSKLISKETLSILLRSFFLIISNPLVNYSFVIPKANQKMYHAEGGANVQPGGAEIHPHVLVEYSEFDAAIAMGIDMYILYDQIDEECL